MNYSKKRQVERKKERKKERKEPNQKRKKGKKEREKGKNIIRGGAHKKEIFIFMHGYAFTFLCGVSVIS